MSSIVVVGSINADLTVHVRSRPRVGETVTALGFTRTVGGKGANQAVAAAVEGATVRFIGAVGCDGPGKNALSVLTDAGVDTSGIGELDEVETGTALITISADGENDIVVVPGANHRLSPDDIVAQVRAQGTEDVILLSQGELGGPVLHELARLVTSAEIPWILNLAPYVELPTPVLRCASIIVVNETEFSSLAHALRVPLDQHDHGAERAVADVLNVSLVVTRGASPSVVIEGGSASTVATHRAESVVDTTGAGDAFVGALAAALSRGAGLLAAADRGARLGAVAVAHPGASLTHLV